MVNKLALYLSCILLCSVISCKPKQELLPTKTDHYYFDGAFRFLEKETLMDALDKAADMNKPLFVEFYTDWCLPCKMMSEEVFVNVDLATTFNEQFLNYKIHAEKGDGPNMKFLYNVEEIPTFLFLDLKGRELIRAEGGLTQQQLLEEAQKALAKWQGVSGVLNQM